MSDIRKFELADMVRQKSLELAGRAMRLASEAKTEGEIDFAIAIIEESESAITFWTEQLKAEVRS
ncbi:hypothetical protein [Pararhodobacter sp.]|uniref:hypothetical protein n=1 Tax=Pararhodobacter sp. TaxID=2127056 RepID=UPI002AFE7DBA|nr:hypothetical protein [Pararhodobacter sp.]